MLYYVLNRWHTGTVTEHHLQQYRVMGVCIPERLHVQDLMSNTTLVSGGFRERERENACFSRKNQKPYIPKCSPWLKVLVLQPPFYHPLYIPHVQILATWLRDSLYMQTLHRWGFLYFSQTILFVFFMNIL